jgi:hypothetical protein
MSLLERKNKLRQELIELAKQSSLTNAAVVAKSQELDRVIVEMQRRLAK